MKNTIIPAQITTVEDKIAGSLSLSQILIMLLPVLISAIVYGLFYPAMKIAPYKMGLILFSIFTCLLLAIRIKEKLVLEWISIFLNFMFRPRLHLYNKNCTEYRDVVMPEYKKEVARLTSKSKQNVANFDLNIKINDLVKLEHLLQTGKLELRYQFDKRS